MTDFGGTCFRVAEVVFDLRELVHPVTTAHYVTIDEALGTMKVRAVRLLLATGDADIVIGIITARDIQAEKPIKLAQAFCIAHSAITIEAIITPQSEIEVLNFLSGTTSRWLP